MNLKDKLNEIKKNAYHAIGSAERQITHRVGVLGKAADALDLAKSKALEVKANVDANGGIETILDDKLSEADAKIVDLSNRFVSKLELGYDKIEKDLSPGGNLDRTLDDVASVTKLYGLKAVNGLQNLVKKGTDAAKRDFRSHVPSQQEISTRYFGIGTDYKGILLRPNLDACLDFYKKTQKTMGTRGLYRAEILSDIKASASANKQELLAYYSQKTGKHTVTKIESVERNVKD